MEDVIEDNMSFQIQPNFLDVNLAHKLRLIWKMTDSSLMVHMMLLNFNNY